VWDSGCGCIVFVFVFFPLCLHIPSTNARWWVLCAAVFLYRILGVCPHTTVYFPLIPRFPSTKEDYLVVWRCGDVCVCVCVCAGDICCVYGVRVCVCLFFCAFCLLPIFSSICLFSKRVIEGISVMCMLCVAQCARERTFQHLHWELCFPCGDGVLVVVWWCGAM
jgi:hypothetical protein